MKRILILSGKGGTGKTTTAAAFIHFANAQAMADCDVDAPNLHLISHQTGQVTRTPFLGSEKARIDADRCIGCGTCLAHCRFNAIRQDGGCCTVNEYACEGCGVCEFVCPQKAVTLSKDVAGEQTLTTGRRVFSTARLKMGRGNSGKLVSAVKLAMLKNAPDCPLAVIDGSPGIGCPVIASISGVDLVLIVAEPSLSGLSDLKRLLESAKTFRVQTAVCVNKWDASPENTAAIEVFCQEEGLPFLGKIPYDSTASRAINDGRSLAEIDCPATTALHRIYEQAIALLNI